MPAHVGARQNWTPVLFATARDEEGDRILGLELGADDYVTKPFSPRELVTRIRTVSRRAVAGPASKTEELCIGSVRVVVEQRRVCAVTRSFASVGRRRTAPCAGPVAPMANRARSAVEVE